MQIIEVEELTTTLKLVLNTELTELNGYLFQNNIWQQSVYHSNLKSHTLYWNLSLAPLYIYKVTI